MLSRHPRLGPLLLAVNSEPQAVRAWEHGAAGEETVATYLTKHCSSEVTLLHDRRMPTGRGNIDHIAIAPSGVWVIDTKRYKGRVQVQKPWFGEPKLTVAGRDRTKLIDGLERQVAAVTTAIADQSGTVPVQGALCFVDAELPLLSTPSIRGYELLGRRGLARRLNQPGPLPEFLRGEVGGRLERALRPA